MTVAKHNPAANTAAVVTVAGSASNTHRLHRIDWGYDANPAGGSVQVSVGGSVVWGPIPITTGGPGFQDFRAPIEGDLNEALVVTLAAGGGSVSGALAIQYYSAPGSVV